MTITALLERTLKADSLTDAPRLLATLPANARVASSSMTTPTAPGERLLRRSSMTLTRCMRFRRG